MGLLYFFHVDSHSVDFHIPDIGEEQFGDGSGDCLGHTLEVYHMLEDDTPSLSCISDKCFSVQGRLREHAHFWEEQLEALRFVLDIVKAGYCLPFIAFPPPLVAKNHKSALENAKFVKESIDELVQSRCVQKSGVLSHSV